MLMQTTRLSTSHWISGYSLTGVMNMRSVSSAIDSQAVDTVGNFICLVATSSTLLILLLFAYSVLVSLGTHELRPIGESNSPTTHV